MGFLTMKSLALLLVIAVVSARDLSKYKPGWMRNPTLVKIHEAMHGGIKSGIVGGDEAAPHCCDGAFFIEVVMGAHRIRDNEATQQRQTTYDFATHENWDTNNLANDICWVHLTSKVSLDSNIQTITLQNAGGDPNPGEMVEATGWGRPFDASGGISDVLREVTVPVLSNEDCDAVYSIVNNGHICIDSKGGKGTCNGDSGGPLTCAEGHLVGITSFGAAAGCEAGYPDAFTRVSYFRDWIREKTGV